MNMRQKPKKPRPEPAEVPIKEKLELPELFIPNFRSDLPSPNCLNKIQQLEEQLNQVQAEKSHLKTELSQANEQKEVLQNNLKDLSNQNISLQQAKACETTEKSQLQQDLAIAEKTIGDPEEPTELGIAESVIDRHVDNQPEIRQLRQDMMRVGAACRNELLADTHGKRQIGQPISMQMPELSSAEPKLDSAESVFGDRDVRPGRYLMDYLLLNAFAHRLTPIRLSHQERCALSARTGGQNREAIPRSR